MDILTTLVEESGLRVSVEVISRSLLIKRLEKGSCDIALGLADLPNYRVFTDFIFSIPLYYSTTSFFTEGVKPEKISSVGHLFNLQIAHQKDKQLSIGLEQAINDNRLERLTFNELDQGFQLLDQKLIDGVLANDVTFRYVLKLNDSTNKFRRIPISFLPHVPSFLGLSKNIEADKRAMLKSQLSEILKQMHLSGRLSNIIKSHVY